MPDHDHQRIRGYADTVLSKTDVQLDAIKSELDQLEDRIPGLLQTGEYLGQLSNQPADSPAERTVLTALTAVQQQHPGAWLRPNEIASYVHDRTKNRDVTRAVERLRGAGRIESIVIAFEQRRLLMVRLPNTITINTGTTQEHINQALHAIGHHITIRPSRLVSRNFTPVTVHHDGQQLEAWQHTRPYEVTVEPR
jgi:hypothetical protein